ncbi:LutC/YkgG family protein [Sporolactobacillus inulinus]|jgi:L-lactate dehydrogenase complex protein LldG|uniref:Lactate utilization protein C n=1 Tax=Sporolactobacillus inulinus CASD TaxID=1069536 RepID=A0A0U1QR59_9BACL|nr:lactate utilization protein C [Sporolactobacillus inulinus]KLI03294.1 lactate utilization protein C [Sporolactobacillus inulinus CASD]GEB78016.1 lactate utilization protein C [Sporolactobacillus inulinus]
MKGTIENRDSFLEKIADKLKRTPGEAPEKPVWTYTPQNKVYQNYSEDQLLAMMKEACAPIHTKLFETNSEQLGVQLDQLIAEYGGGSIIATNDLRFHTFGLDEILKKNNVAVWDYKEGHKAIERATHANIGLSICDVMLAESATAGLFNDQDKARSVSLLPVTSIVIVPKSSIVPRMTQAMQRVEERVQKGETISSYINFISGPSNSADIEMKLVVGVHGPVKVAYLVVADR